MIEDLDGATALGAALIGLGAGALGSLMGIGGGILITPALVQFFGVSIDVAVCASLLAIVLNSSTVSLSRLKSNKLSLSLVMTLAPALVVGGFLSRLWAKRVDVASLEVVFGLFVLSLSVWTLWKMVKKKDRSEPNLNEELSWKETELSGSRLAIMAFCVMCIASFAGLIGIGGGVLLVPVLTQFLRVPLKISTGTSSHLIGFSASAAVVTSMGSDSFNVPLSAAVALGSVVGATIIDRFYGKIESRWIQWAYITLLSLIGLSMLSGARS